jgi:hypothetical protein
MRVTVLTGLTFALLWITVKMIFFWTGALGTNIKPAVLLNMLFLLSAIAVGLYLHKRQEKEPGNALLDIKNAMTAGVPYLVTVALFIYFYYGSIDPEFNQHQISEALTGIQKELDSPEGLANYRESNAEFEVMTKEEIFESIRTGPETFYSAKATAIIALLAMLLLATLNSILVAVIYRKIVFR